MMKRNGKRLLLCMVISFGVMGLSALLTMGSDGYYQTLRLPPLAPPGWVFPIVWGILFFLMGYSSYRISISHSLEKQSALRTYGVQLVFNVAWSVVFFRAKALLVALAVLLVLWGLIIGMVVQFRRIDRTAGWLQVPYLLWVTFAAYLNLMIYWLN